MLPLAGIPESVADFMSEFREFFKRERGFEIVERYIAGLILSGNKTLEGIHSQLLWQEGEEIKRRGMHNAVFEADWQREKWMPRHRQKVSKEHRGKGREIISIDWTLSPHERGEKIYGVKKAYDYTQRK